MGVFGARISRQMTPGERRQPTLLATLIVSVPASATPANPIAICTPQMTARIVSAVCPEAAVIQTASCATGSHETTTSVTPIRILTARPAWTTGGVTAGDPYEPAAGAGRMISDGPGQHSRPRPLRSVIDPSVNRRTSSPTTSETASRRWIREHGRRSRATSHPIEMTWPRGLPNAAPERVA